MKEMAGWATFFFALVSKDDSAWHCLIYIEIKDETHSAKLKDLFIRDMVLLVNTRE